MKQPWSRSKVGQRQSFTSGAIASWPSSNTETKTKTKTKTNENTKKSFTIGAIGSWPSFKDKNYHGPKLACQEPDEKDVKSNFEVSGIGGTEWVKYVESYR